MRQQHSALHKAKSWREQRACGKVGFPSKKAAKGRADALGFGFYKCPTCRRWHISKQAS